jgi:hypothetical protein
MWCSGTLNAGIFCHYFFFLTAKFAKIFANTNDCKVFLIGRFPKQILLLFAFDFLLLNYERIKNYFLGTVARVVLYFNGHSHIGDVSFFGAVYIDGKRLSLFF